VTASFEQILDAAETGAFDFFLANPAVYSCVGTEVGAAALATVSNKCVRMVVVFFFSGMKKRQSSPLSVQYAKVMTHFIPHPIVNFSTLFINRRSSIVGQLENGPMILMSLVESLLSDMTEKILIPSIISKIRSSQRGGSSI